MKRIFALVVLSSMILTSIACTQQIEDKDECQKRLIQTSGESEVSGNNDSARIDISVVTQNKNLDSANKDNTRKSNTVIDALKALKIKDAKIKTSNYRVSPQRDYKIKPYLIMGYEITNSVNVTMEGVDQKELSGNVSKILDTAIAAGANQITNVQFYIDDIDALQNEALQIATKKAIAKAEAIAGAAGVGIKEIAYINTTGSRPPVYRSMRPSFDGAEAKAMMATPIESGESKVTVSVNLACEIK